MRHNHDKKGILYLATFDPTVSATGTATRGKLFLRFFCEHYDTHLVHMKEKDEEGKDKSIVSTKQRRWCYNTSQLTLFLLILKSQVGMPTCYQNNFRYPIFIIPIM